MTPLELLTRAARPATRLMDSLTLNSKLAVIAAAFIAAALGVSALLVIGINREVQILHLQNEGQEAAIKGLDLMVQVALHDIAVQQDPQRAGELRSEVQSARQQLDGELAELERSEALQSAQQLLSDAIDSALQPEEDGNLVMQRHRGALDATLHLIERVADETALNRVRDLHTAYLVRTAIDNVPLLLDRSFRLRALGALVIEAEAVWVEDRIDIVGATRDMDRAKDDLATAVALLHSYEPDSREALDRLLAEINGSTDSLRQQIQERVLDAEEIELSERELDALAGRVVEAVAEGEKLFKGLLDRQLELRISGLQSERRLVIGGIVLALLIAGYLFIGFTTSVGRAVRQIGAAADDLASGVFRDRVDVQSRDEMRQIADSMEKVTGAVKRFAASQTEMAERHAAGFMSHRIDADSFAGEYRRLAEGVNQLVDAQIQMSVQAVGLMGRYGAGDLSEDMPELPGEKKRITEAMHTTKANLTAISAEIQRLVGAANAGDFSARGDAERFQHEFRRMIEGLNSLMAVSDSGLRDVGRVLDALAKGDLTETITAEYRGQFDALKQAANTTVAQLGQLIGQVKQATDSINTAAREISAGNSDLSARTEQQAASLEETASSMEELTSTVRQNAENARSANQLAIGAGEVAEKGGSVVGQVVGTMGDIDAASRKIVDIISVIDGIAFQTNILALNAAVEAARAGEQGRGFAVVAGEVRSLAQRSAAAAKEIKGLIGDTVDKIATGSALVDSAGKTMGEIVTSVKRVTDIMGEISAASAEQSSGIEQVNTTITQMDEVTQQNAALVEEASASARALEDQAASLAESVSRFRLAATSAAAQSRAPIAAAAALPSKKVADAPRPAALAGAGESAPPMKSAPTAIAKPAPAKPKPVTTPTATASAAKPRAIKPSAKPISAEGDDMEWTEF